MSLTSIKSDAGRMFAQAVIIKPSKCTTGLYEMGKACERPTCLAGQGQEAKGLPIQTLS